MSKKLPVHPSLNTKNKVHFGQITPSQRDTENVYSDRQAAARHLKSATTPGKVLSGQIGPLATRH
jgi:hypothetical protein